MEAMNYLIEQQKLMQHFICLQADPAGAAAVDLLRSKKFSTRIVLMQCTCWMHFDDSFETHFV